MVFGTVKTKIIVILLKDLNSEILDKIILVSYLSMICIS